MELLLADTNEFHPVIDAVAYRRWSPAIILRAHNGWREDYEYATSRNLVERAGVPTVGHYGYVVAGVDAGQQGRDFARVVAAHGGLPVGHFIACDLEEGTGDQAPRVAAWLAAAHSILATGTARDVLYSGLAFWRAHLGGTVPGLLRWVAAYGQSSPPGMGETLWQFTDHRIVPGVAGACDCSTFAGSAADLAALLGDHTHPQTQGAPVTLRDVLPPGKLTAPIMAVKDRPGHPGSGWRFAADGGVFPFGDAPMLGNPTGVKLAAPIVDAAVAENGYTLIGSDGGSFPYGPGAPKVDSLA